MWQQESVETPGDTRKKQSYIIMQIYHGKSHDGARRRGKAPQKGGNAAAGVIEKK